MKLMSLAVCVVTVAFFTACNGGNTDHPVVPAEPKIVEDTNSSNPDYTAGLALVGQSDCATCHKVEDVLVGPSYSSIANKYPLSEENVNRLAQTIVKGVTADKAVWGKVPMAPHPKLSDADAVKMVKYIMLLKK